MEVCPMKGCSMEGCSMEGCPIKKCPMERRPMEGCPMETMFLLSERIQHEHNHHSEDNPLQKEQDKILLYP